MSALRDYPPLSLVPPLDPKRPRRTRPIVAVLLLTVMGLLVAASVLASRPYQPGPAPKPGHYQPPADPADPAGPAGPNTDHC